MKTQGAKNCALTKTLGYYRVGSAEVPQICPFGVWLV